jgi:hydroxyacylglutathione hydrolase
MLGSTSVRRTHSILVAGLLALSVAVMTSETTFEPGTLPARWAADSADCAGVAPFRIHEYNPALFIIRQSGCTNFEKPFLYILVGSKQALLVDTGATGADPIAAVDEVMARVARRAGKSPPLLVVHSHGHGDHIAGDAALRKRAATRVVDPQPEALVELFGLQDWPRGVGEYDLGDRVVDIIPIPGHQPASIAIYDRRTGILLTGDTLYPGRLYVRDRAAFVASIDRLVAFTMTHDVAHVLGAHVENSRTPFVDYPEGTVYKTYEHVLELGRSHLLELRDALQQMGGQLERRRLRDFTVWPVNP